MWRNTEGRVHLVHTSLFASRESGALKLPKVDQNRVPFWQGQFASSIRVCIQRARISLPGGMDTRQLEARYVLHGDVRPSARLLRVLPG